MKKHLLFLVSLVTLSVGNTKAQPSKVLPHIDIPVSKLNREKVKEMLAVKFKL